MLPKLSVALAIMTALGLASTASAQTSSVPGSWDFVVGSSTDNRSKAVSKSDREPYVFGQAIWSSSDQRFYAIPEFETIRSSSGSRLELALTAGFKPQFMGFDLDLNTAHKWQVGADTGTNTDDDAWEFTADVKRSVGPASARLRLQHSPDGTGSTRAWTWVAGRVGWDFSPRLSGTAELGHRQQDNAVDYTGWNIGLSYAATRSVELDLRWHDTDADTAVSGDKYGSALVAGISLAF